MPKQPISYRAMQSELDDILVRLQAEDIELDQAIALHDKGQKLADEIEEYLKKAENTITKHRTEA